MFLVWPVYAGFKIFAKMRAIVLPHFSEVATVLESSTLLDNFKALVNLLYAPCFSDCVGYFRTPSKLRFREGEILYVKSDRCIGSQGSSN